VAVILMDTNLLVYLVDQNEPERQSRALETLGLLELHQVGRLSVQNLAEFFNVAVRKLHPGLPIEKAMEWTGRFVRVWPVFDLTPQIVLEAAQFFNVAVRKLHPGLPIEKAMEWTGRFVRVWPVFDLTPQIVLEATRGVRDYKLSYYDAQIWATARLNQVTIVFSEDFQDGLFLEGVKFVNPFAPGFDINQWI